MLPTVEVPTARLAAVGIMCPRLLLLNLQFVLMGNTRYQERPNALIALQVIDILSIIRSLLKCLLVSLICFYFEGSSCKGGVQSVCVKGFYSSGGLSSCLACDAGTYSNSGAAYCTMCSPGMYAASTQGPCHFCEASYHCVGGIRKACDNGTFSSGNATSCSPCPSGSYCVNNSVYKCPPGFACLNGDKKACDAGSYSL